MTVEYIEYKGIQYITRLVYLMNVEYQGQCQNAYIADYELWNAIKDDCDAGAKEATEIDSGIYFYCDSGFIASEPTDKEIINYLKERLSHEKEI